MEIFIIHFYICSTRSALLIVEAAWPHGRLRAKVCRGTPLYIFLPDWQSHVILPVFCLT